jgi:[protein-PII] uridylyltransferase
VAHSPCPSDTITERAPSRPPLAPDIVQTTRHYLELHLRPLREQALRGLGGTAHARRVAAVYDGLLSAFFLGASATVRQHGGLKGPVALLAVGGYGRGMLGLGSDLDLVLLAPSTDDPALAALAETLLYPLWDAGVAIGHSVRSPEELVALSREDLRTATTILDARVIAGDAAFGEEVIARGWRALFDGDVNHFLDELAAEMTGRHGRYGASVYLLEPDVKHGRGALRDLDIARWALRARYRSRDFGEALRQGAISQHDAAQLEAAREFCWRVRGVMHGRTGRRTDRLTFDEQEECARALGFVDPAEEAEEALRAVGAGAERFMQAYYRHARTVATTVDRLLESCRVARASAERVPRAERVTEGVERFDGMLTFADQESLRRDPALALRIVELALHHGLPLAPRARDMVAQCAREPQWAEALRASPASGPLLQRLVAHAAPATLRTRGAPVSVTEQGSSVLAELHDLGLLLAMVPEFGPVTGRVHHDVYHVYTVDVHSVAAVDRLHQIARGEMPESYALARRVLADVERRDLLCLATLLHDVGKGRGGDHSAVGSELTLGIARRLGLSSDEAEQVAWLVRQHLALYHFATRRDLGDPATLAQITDLVRDPWRLRALYLLTVADLSTTSPTAMTSWKARMLDELLERTEVALGQRDGRLTLQADELRRRAVAAGGPEDAHRVEAFVASMPQRYLLATPPEAIVRHARVVSQAQPGRALVHLAPLEGEGPADLAEVVIVAPDRPGLLARLAAVLYANRLDVQSAQVYSRESPAGRDAVDVFTVRRLDDDPGGLMRLAARLPRDLAALLDDDAQLEKLIASRARTGLRRPEPRVRTEIAIDNHVSDRYTVIEVFGRDRPGLLYAIAQALFELGLSIALSKVNTEGRRVADVFYVTGTDGEKVPPERFETIRARLAAAMEGG